MSRKCQNCGAEMTDSMNFCPKCHAKYDVPSSAPPPAAVPPAAENYEPRIELGFVWKMWQRRITRRDFWIWQLILFVINAGSVFIPFAGPVIVFFTVFYASDICWSRLHDAGKSAWNMLWILLPVIGWIILIVKFCQPSEPGSNAWGPESQRMFGGNN